MNLLIPRIRIPRHQLAALGVILFLALLSTIRYYYYHLQLRLSSPAVEVPDIFHLIHLDNPDFPFISFICVLSIWLNHGPRKILIHSNIPERLVSSARFLALQKLTGLGLVEVVPCKKPTHVFGSALSSVFHSSDVLKLQLAIEQGGVFLDQVLKEFGTYSLTCSEKKFEVDSRLESILTNDESIPKNILNSDAGFVSNFISS